MTFIKPNLGKTNFNTGSGVKARPIIKKYAYE